LREFHEFCVVTAGDPQVQDIGDIGVPALRCPLYILGRKLVDGAKSVRIFGQEVPVRASIHTMGGFSAHADQTGLLDSFSVMAPSRPRTIITHGEDRARKAFSDLIHSSFGVKTECPALGDVIEI
jgi:metallo-beta-lactamase family protein